LTDEFFNDFRDFDVQREKQHGSGTNDFSLFASVLNPNDEVRLHSRFLHALFNPKGTHNKGSLFAEHFLAVLDFRGWLLDWSNLKARRETGSIDLYLTDGTHHVIIENKLNAADQKAQIQRYVEQVAESSEADADNILVVYLSKGRAAPSAYSLGTLQLSQDGDFLVDLQGKPRAHYRACHYGTEILNWIGRCEEAVKDAPNLAHALREYRHVVELATNTYKSKQMNLESFLANGDSAERIRFACKINAEMPSIKAAWLKNFFTDDLPAALQGKSLQRLEEEQVQNPKLYSWQFEPAHARAFFGVGKSSDDKDKGGFWLVTDGPYRDRLALVVFYGLSNLHIGVLTLARSAGDSGPWKLAGDAPALKLDADFKKHGPVQAVLPGLTSWSVRLDDVIGGLAHFKNSEQAKPTAETAGGALSSQI